MVTQSEAEARAVLEKYRKQLIAAGRLVAIELAADGRTIIAHDVFDEMVRRGALPADARRTYWLACVFKYKGSREIWEHQGMAIRTEKARNIHAKPIMHWKLRVPADEAIAKVFGSGRPQLPSKHDPLQGFTSSQIPLSF